MDSVSPPDNTCYHKALQEPATINLHPMNTSLSIRPRPIRADYRPFRPAKKDRCLACCSAATPSNDAPQSSSRLSRRETIGVAAAGAVAGFARPSRAADAVAAAPTAPPAAEPGVGGSPSKRQDRVELGHSGGCAYQLAWMTHGMQRIVYPRTTRLRLHAPESACWADRPALPHDMSLTSLTATHRVWESLRRCTHATPRAAILLIRPREEDALPQAMCCSRHAVSCFLRQIRGPLKVHYTGSHIPSDRLRAGLMVTPVGIGAWSWGDRSGYWGYGKGYQKEDNEEAFKALVESGVGLIDTAEVGLAAPK